MAVSEVQCRTTEQIAVHSTWGPKIIQFPQYCHLLHILGCYEKYSAREIPIAIDLERKEALRGTTYINSYADAPLWCHLGCCDEIIFG